MFVTCACSGAPGVNVGAGIARQQGVEQRVEVGESGISPLPGLASDARPALAEQ